MRAGVEIHALAGLHPCEAFSRLSRETRRSQGSLPQPVFGLEEAREVTKEC
jgi:hypothetical protein